MKTWLFALKTCLPRKLKRLWPEVVTQLWQDVMAFLASTPPPRKRRTALLRLEALEVRAVPAGMPNVWTDGTQDGLWSTGDNWSLKHVPLASETPTFRNDPAFPNSLDKCTIHGDGLPRGLAIQASY